MRQADVQAEMDAAGEDDADDAAKIKRLVSLVESVWTGRDGIGWDVM